MQSDGGLNARVQYVPALAGDIGSRKELKRTGGGRKKERSSLKMGRRWASALHSGMEGYEDGEKVGERAS